MAGLALYAAGWWLGYPEPVVLGFACLLAVAVAVLWTLPRPRLSVQRGVAPRKVVRGERAQATVSLRNEGRRLRGGLRAVDACGASTVMFGVPALAAGATHSAAYRLPTGRRGEIPVGPLQFVRADPLGLARRVQRFGTADTLLVRPRTCALPMLSSGRAHHVEGPTSASADDGTITFHALREYVLGDDLRRVHWRYTARTGTLMVRQMVDVSLPHTTLVLDTRAVAYPPEDGAGEGGAGEDGDREDRAWEAGAGAVAHGFELAVDAAASIALAAARSNFPVRLVTPDGLLLETGGAATDADMLLDLLAVVVPSAQPTLAVAFDGLGAVRAGGSLVVVTGLGDTAGLARMGVVRQRFERAVLVRAGGRRAPAGRSAGDRDPGPAVAGPAEVPADVTQLIVGGLDELMSGWRREAGR